MKVRVTVSLKPSVLDPQGETLRAALSRIGIPGVDKVRVGKVFDLEVSGGTAEQVRANIDLACRKLLANPVMEIYTISVEE